MNLNLIDRPNLEQLLRYIRPRNLKHYQEVFVHRSAVRFLQRQEESGISDISTNERLEFLGDVVLCLAVTDFLYDRYPDCNEGFLTKLRIKIVKGPTLADFASRLGIQNHLRLSNSTTINNNILENAFEALVGAVYLDYRVVGMEMHFVKKFVFGVLHDMVDWTNVTMDDNYKDVLMRHTQRLHVPLPQYTIESTTGQAHRPLYKVALSIQDEVGKKHETSAEAGTKRDAEQLCAKAMLNELDMGNVTIVGFRTRVP